MFFQKKHKVIIKNKNITIEAKAGSNLFKLLKDHNIELPTLCLGNGQCGKCKVHISSSEFIQKPTKKERLILARMSLDEGFRLACQYIIKSDIIINTEVFMNSNASEIGKIKVKDINESEENIEFNQKNNIEISNNIESNEKIEDDNEVIESNDNILNNEIVESCDNNKNDIDDKDISSSNKDDIIEDSIEEDFSLTDGLLLIQYARGIKYYLFSAGINNISAEGFIKTDESIVDLVDNNSICDFVYNYTEIRDIERILIILDKRYFDGKNLLGLVNYYSFNLGTLLCEIIQPENKAADLLTFLRLIRVKNNNLIFHLDNLTNVFLTKDKSIINFNANYVSDEINLNDLMAAGKNPIVSISDDLLEIKVNDIFLPPTGINFSTLLKTVVLLDKFGVIDNDFKLKDRTELLDNVPLDILVKLSKRDGIDRFYVYRKNKVEISITQNVLDILSQLRNFIRAVIVYAETKFGKIEHITFDTIGKFENMTNELLNLNMIPTKYSNKLIHLTGDPTIFATKFFNEKSIINYLNNNFVDFNEVELYKDTDFNNKY